MGKKKGNGFPNGRRSGNAMLNKIHGMERAVYDKKLEIAMQMCFDASVLACREVFQLGPGRFLKYAEEFSKNLNAISTLFAQDSADLEYSVARLDGALKEICGEENHTPFDKRYY